MKSVMISNNPEECELIGSGKKTIDLFKTKPKCNTPFKCYIYCRNEKDTFVNFFIDTSKLEQKLGNVATEK